MYIKYKSVTGEDRIAVHVERLDWFVKWHRDQEPCGVSRYRLEDNSIVQIPDRAWELVEGEQYDD